MLRAAGFSDRGPIRPNNEDCFAVDERLGLCLVADGLGGHNAGEIAARIAVDAVVDFVRDRSADASRSVQRKRSIQPEREPSGERFPFGYDDAFSPDANVLRTAIQLASLQILEAAVMTHAYAGMGTTIVAARVDGDRLTVAHVGDSRLYVLDRGDLRQITNDDSWAAAMLAKDPAADRLLLMNHPFANALTSVVGASARTEVHLVEERLTDGDMVLLTTDGVHGVIDQRRLRELLTEGGDPAAIAADVVRTAIARGSDDNCTAIIARYTA